MRAWFGQTPAVERALLIAERTVALLSRCEPTNGRLERERLRKGLELKDPALPRWVYRPVPDLAELRRRLERMADELEPLGPLESLYAERARELSLEAGLVEAIGRPGFAALAGRRFAAPDPNSASAASARACEWVSLSRAPHEEALASDDESNPKSLASRLRQELGSLRLPFRVEVCPMVAAAATGNGVVLVCEGRHLSRRETERIVAHEVHGHVLPRWRASQERLPLFRVGSARGNDEQEGYALFQESRRGHLDEARKRELALRHLAAVGVQQGAEWVDTVRLLQARATSTEETLTIASRVHRAGGLAREAVYLPAYVRVEAAVKRDPGVLDELGRGRLSLEAVATLEKLQRPASRVS